MFGRLLLCLCVFFSIVPQAAPLSIPAPKPGLPESVKPLRYEISLEPDLEQATFSGKVTIHVHAPKPTSEIVLNSLGLEIVSAQAGDEKLVPKTDDVAQTLTLTATKPLEGWSILTITFRGKLSERPQGLYLTRYQLPDGTWKKALVTQMEPADARRMFPCWDEPGFRCSFQLTALVPATHTALFNMPIERETPRGDGKKEVVFASTPPMSSYLVAFASAELESIEDEIDGIQLRLFATPGKREQMRYAMEVTKKVLPWYREYFGIAYPLPKLDQVAFPGVSASGMENWGCIVYADRAMLFDEKQSSQASRERVFDVVAHEIAHQWFGDLVTMQWWDDLWLNEGFASWMATKVGAIMNPSWKKWERAADGKEAAMRLDARETTHPIQQRVYTAGEATQAFDEITYSKGQAFLRMLESWLGEEKFRDGLRLYFKKHAKSNTTTADLWAALSEASGQPVKPLARDWTEQPGFPVIRASATGAGLELSQQRFTIHQDNASPLRWQIPVAVQSGERTELVLLQEIPKKISADSPCLVNRGAHGYFRVWYDASAWTALLARAERLAEIDRLTLLLDAWAMVQANRAPLSRWIELAGKLWEDPSPLVGAHIAGVMEYLDRFAPAGRERDSFQTWARYFLGPAWRRLGWDSRPGEDLSTVGYRADLLRILGKLGDEEVLAEARRRALRFLEEPSSLPADLRAPVLHLAGRQADAALWERLYALARTTADTEQKELLYGALVAVQDSTLVARTLSLALAGELPSKTAVRLVGRVAAEGNQAELAWKFARSHQEELLNFCSAWEASQYFARLSRNFTDVAYAKEIEEMTRSSLPPDAARPAAIAADEIRFAAEFKARVWPALSAWIQAGKGSGR